MLRVSQKELETRKEVWGALRDLIRGRATPSDFAKDTGCPLPLILRGFSGESIALDDDFLRKSVIKLGLAAVSARTRYFEETEDILTPEDCVRLILDAHRKMHPRQTSFWDSEVSSKHE